MGKKLKCDKSLLQELSLSHLTTQTHVHIERMWKGGREGGRLGGVYYTTPQ